jgi:glycosyltransferase involved in cell wall biosynthesis
MRRLIWNLLVVLFAPIFLIAAALPSARRRKIIWGSTPLINNKYWSAAVKEAGYDSLTVTDHYYSINKADDFDRLMADFGPSGLPRLARTGLGFCLALIWALRNARVMHMSYDGFALGRTWLWWLEPRLYRMAGIKTVIIPYGADAWMYSRVIDISLRHGLMASYPLQGRIEPRIRRRVEHWNSLADIVIAASMIDGAGRWDVVMNQNTVIDTRAWEPRTAYSANDGRNGPVRVIHTPNHRGCKGTEFIVAAAEKLKAEGLQVELVLLEGVANEEVKRRLLAADILIEQLLIGYALSGVEGMATGIAVMSNLDNEAYTRVHRRFGFLDECPILSTTPETVTDNLRALVTDPALREQLGRAGRAYVEKYHSYEMARYLFGSIYENFFDGAKHDLMRLFHPLLSEYNRRRPYVRHPLVENRLPPPARDG